MCVVERAMEILRLSIVNAVIEAKVIHRLSTLLSKPCRRANCHQLMGIYAYVSMCVLPHP